MSVFDRPTSKELLEAVIDFIDAEIKSDSYPANKKFKFQIVLNVLNIVKREVETGEEINKKFSELGSKLIGENEFTIEKLSQKIRDKEFDHEDKDLIDFLYDLTEEKIKIDNPKYK
ncbi:DUF6285 domain-containing protein [Gammaproteobacteria bacterium]|nr:DUF6285 domain-containing protein [Gammaproteobacteria bacterium]